MRTVRTHIIVAAILLAALALTPGPASARTWYVNPEGTGDAASIEIAVEDSAASGDTVMLADGTYYGSTAIGVWAGKSVTVRSESGDPAACLLEWTGGVFGVAGSLSLRDVTVTASWAVISSSGGWARAYGCIFENCTADVVFRLTSYATGGASGCVFRDNTHPVCAVGKNVNASFTGCLFLRNSAPNGSILNGGDGNATTFTACTFVDNTTSGDMFACPFCCCDIYLTRCIITGSSGGYCAGSVAYMVLTCCNVWGNADGDYVGCFSGQEGERGNFSADPLFCDPEAEDYRLADCSPCLPGYHPEEYDCEGTVGAFGAACICGEATEPTTWGAIKAMYK